MQIKPSSRSAAIGCIALLGLTAVGWLSYLQVNQGRLQERLSPFDPHVIENVVSQQADQSARLAAVETRQNESSIEEQVSDLQKTQSALTLQLQTLDSARLESETLYAAVDERLGSLEKDLTRLRELTAKPTALPAPTTKISSQARKRAVLQPMPFTLIGVETRADESFVSIAPEGSSRLEQIQLLKSGESFQNWRLLRIEPAGKAVFVSNGQERAVSLR